ncbi:MAG: GNAT family N-acetyltransferase [Candidatus Magasanikbacteria bacterium]
MNLSAVKIETERLLLVPVSEKYREDIFHEFSDEITKYMYPKSAECIEETDEFIQSAKKEMELGTDINFTVLNGVTKEFLGGGGIHKLNTQHPEFGIWIKKSAHGNKYGQEVVKAIKVWLDNNTDYEYITYPCDRRNMASCKVAESLGGKIYKEYKEKNIIGFELDEVEYKITK